MAKIPINIGGGGSGASSDECTATADDVLAGKIAVFDGSGDEPSLGTMKDYSGTTTSATSSLDSTNSRVQLTVPNTGKYDTLAKLYDTYSNIASLIGLTAAKIATGNSLLGLSGTYTGLGSATAAQVLSGKTFSTASLSNATGTMTDKSGSTTSATSSLDSSNSRVRLIVPTTGYYDTSAYLYASYSNIASLIGLTAAKLATGNSALGISGTYTGLGSATAAQVLSGKTFSTASLSNASGTMTDKSGSSTSATASLDTSNSRFRLIFPTTGYYNTSSYLYSSYSNVASLLGLTAAKIVSGNTILGISGTFKKYNTTGGTITDVTTSDHPTQTLYSGSSGSTSVSIRTIEIDDIGFTPSGAWFLTDYGATLCDEEGNCTVRNGDAGSGQSTYYLSNNTGVMSFSSDSVIVPLYFTGTTTCWYRIVGY